MMSRNFLAQLGAAAALMMALHSEVCYAQPADGGGGPGDGGGGGDDGGGGGGGGDAIIATVNCAQNGTDAHYEEFFDGEGGTMVRWAGTDTGCPNHLYLALDNAIGEAYYAGVLSSNASIPAYPMMFADGAATDLSTTANNIGVMRNGVGMFSSWAVGQVVDYETTAYYLESGSLDVCGGHATSGGKYHYHGTAGCLQEQAGGVAGSHSPQLGWSHDGFPLYGQLGPGGVEMKMCGSDGADEEVCLDECMGYEALIDEDEFKYRYYGSCGFDESFYPFTPNCNRGCCPDGFTCDQSVEACGDNPVEGYTETYVPEVSTPVVEPYDANFIEGLDTDLIGVDYSVNCTLFLGSGGDGTSASAADDDDADFGISGASRQHGRHAKAMLSCAAAAVVAATAAVAAAAAT